MIDGAIKGTGNSRFLKSSIPAGTTWEQALAMLINGTFPIDLNGLNAAGWTTLATALIKANLLTDATAAKIAAALGVTAPNTVNEAFDALAYTPVKIAVGSYTGTGTYGRGSPTSIPIFSNTKFVFVIGYYSGDVYTALFANPSTYGQLIVQGNIHSGTLLYATWGTTALQWYCTGADFQLNYSGVMYYYAAISG